jgi:hypothetical protein
MSIDFAPKAFGTKTADKMPTAAADRPKAEFWINLGYTSPVLDDDDKPMFVSLPQGIPLDTQEHLKTNSRNDRYAAFQSARNDLLDQLLEFAKDLKPGEDRIISLQVQLRRVSEEAAPIDPKNNPFATKISF